jgi:hypothetical protein
MLNARSCSGLALFPCMREVCFQLTFQRHIAPWTHYPLWPAQPRRYHNLRAWAALQRRAPALSPWLPNGLADLRGGGGDHRANISHRLPHFLHAFGPAMSALCCGLGHVGGVSESNASVSSASNLLYFRPPAFNGFSNIPPNFNSEMADRLTNSALPILPNAYSAIIMLRCLIHEDAIHSSQSRSV